MVDYCRLVGMLVTLAGWVTIIVAWVKGKSQFISFLHCSGPSSPFQSNTETSTREIVITAFNLTNSTQDAVPFLGKTTKIELGLFITRLNGICSCLYFVDDNIHFFEAQTNPHLHCVCFTTLHALLAQHFLLWRNIWKSLSR